MVVIHPQPHDTEKQDGTSYAWRDYLCVICTIINTRHSHVSLIILINDKYDLHYSIKDDEHD